MAFITGKLAANLYASKYAAANWDCIDDDIVDSLVHETIEYNPETDLLQLTTWGKQVMSEPLGTA